MRNGNIIDERIIAYLDSFYRPQTEALGKLRLQSEDKYIPVILKDTETLLHILLMLIKPKRILEFGTAVGYSASFFAEVCGPDAQIVSLEHNQNMAWAAKENIKNLGYDSQITIIQGDARETAKELEGTFDLIFIDAGKSHYLEFWHAISRNWRPGTVIICDNVLLRGKTATDDFDPHHKFRTNMRHMREFLDFINNDERVITSIFSAGDGLSISIVK